MGHHEVGKAQVTWLLELSPREPCCIRIIYTVLSRQVRLVPGDFRCKFSDLFLIVKNVLLSLLNQPIRRGIIVCIVYQSFTGFIRGILRGVRYAKSLRVLFLHRRSPSWTTLVLYSRAVFIFNEPTISVPSSELGPPLLPPPQASVSLPLTLVLGEPHSLAGRGLGGTQFQSWQAMPD